MVKRTLFIIASLFAGLSLAHAQTTSIRGATKGTSTPIGVTATSVDANHTGIDVNIVGGGGSGGTASNFGAAFPATGTAAGFISSGGNMAGGNLDASGRLIVNCGSGCAGAAGDGTATGALNANNAAVTIALSTYTGIEVNFTSGGNLNGTVVAEVSYDGATSWISAVFIDPVTGATSTSLASPTSGNYSIMFPGSISNARVRVSAYTSGSTTANVRTTAVNTSRLMFGTDGTNLRALSTTNTGVLNVTASNAFLLDATFTGRINTQGQKAMAASTPVVIASDQSAVPVSGTVTANQGGAPWSQNITQFGGVNLSTGTGASGTGIPRVTISNDSSLAANQSVNVNQIGGSAITTLAAGEQKVGVEGLAASGATKSGNPVQIGGVFNTTQPTVTTGQAVEAQATARGALIVASGVDAIAVNNTQQGTASQNVAQFGGTNVSTGTGAGGAGIPRFTMSNDSTIANAFLLDATFTGRFPAAYADADAIANQTTTAVHGQLYGYNGTTWDRLQVDGSKFLKVNCVTGCAGGSSTPADAFANPTTAGLQMDFLMGFNGTTWDRLRVDGSKNLNINCQVGCAGGSSTPTDAFANPTTAGLQMGFNMGWNGSTWDRLQVDASKFLKVNCATGCGASSFTDNSAFSAGSTAVNNSSGVFNDALAAVTSGNAAAFRMTAQRAEHVNIRDSRGNELGQQNNPLIVQQVNPAQTLSFGSGFVDKGTQRVELAINTAAKLPVISARATAGTPTLLEGQPTTLITNLSGNLLVTDGSSDGASFTAGTSNSTEVGGVFNESLTPLTSGTIGVLRATARRALHSNLRDSFGNELGLASNPLQVTGKFALTNQLGVAQFLKFDFLGNLKSRSIISDGTNIAALRGPSGAIQGDYGVVVHPSTAPALQCPFVANISSTAAVQLVTNPGGKFIHVCSFSVIIAGAESISLVEGTGSTCATGTTGLYGGTSASAALAANGGLAMTSDRITIPMQKAGDNVCLLKSAANNASGILTYGIY
jgi:hypothetical protein